MATLYLKTGSTTWAAAGSWSTVNAGGGDNSGPPTAADDCIAELLSGSVTIGAAAVCRSFNATSGTGNWTGTLTHGAFTLNIGDATAGAGNVAITFSAGMTYTISDVNNSRIDFISTSATQQAVNFDAKNTGNHAFTGNGGSWILTSALTQGNSGQILNHTRGSLDLNGQTLSVGRFTSTGALTRSLTLGAATIGITTLTGGVGWQVTSTGMTFSGASATINMPISVARDFTGGGFTYGALNITDSSGTTFATIHDANTFTTLNRATTSVSKLSGLTLFADQTVTGTLTLNGANAASHMLVQSDILGTPRTLTAATVVSNAADFKDITGAGAGSWNLSGAAAFSGDAGGNTGITFTTPATQTSNGTTSFSWSNAARWTSRVPLPQDDVVISNVFISGQTVTIDMPRMGKSINWSGATWAGTAPIWSGPDTKTMYGSLTMVTGVTPSLANGWIFENRSAATVLSAGFTFINFRVAAFGSTLTLLDNLTVGGATGVTILNGTFIDGGFAISSPAFTSNSGLTRTVTRTGTMTLTATGAVFTQTSTGLTHMSQGSTIIISDTSASLKTFAGGGITTYGNLTLTGFNVVITGANTFQTIAINNLGDATGIKFPASTTTTVTGFTTTASSPATMGKIVSSTPGTPATLSKTSGVVSVNYLSIQDSAATGGAVWYAGAQSTNVSGNSGWIFANAPQGGGLGGMSNLLLVGVGS